MKSPISIFLDAYIQAALWSSSDDNDTPLNETYNAGDISGDLMDKMIQDCCAFFTESKLPANMISQAGHDFWLTRNGHGTGFWDKPEIYGEARAQELSKLAEKFGALDLYVGDDGSIYG